jgi:hypothetical protein
MTADAKSSRKPRGVPIPLGIWWHDQVRTAFGELNHEAIARMVNAAAMAAGHANESWTGNEIGKLRRGAAQPTLPLIRAICAVFPVTNPVFIAESAEEANEMRGVQVDHQARRARTAQQAKIEQSETTKMMATLLESQLSAEDIEATNKAAEAAKRRRRQAALRAQRDRTKK